MDSKLLPLARFVGIAAPTLFAGFTAGYSFLFIPIIANNAPNEKIAAKQWFQGYRLGPFWVPPLVLPGTISNLFLAYNATRSLQRNIYILAAIGIFSIAPITFLSMEPGINGACKWRAQMVLRDEGFKLPETNVFAPSAIRHGGSQKARRWAEESSMKELILYWRWFNDFRWVIGGLAAGLSGWATFGMG